jgi:hypothetical protein
MASSSKSGLSFEEWPLVLRLASLSKNGLSNPKSGSRLARNNVSKGNVEQLFRQCPGAEVFMIIMTGGRCLMHTLRNRL